MASAIAVKLEGAGNVRPEVLEMAECDGQHIGHVSGDPNARAHVGARGRARELRDAQDSGGREAPPAAPLGANDVATARVHVSSDVATACVHVGARQPVVANDDATARIRAKKPTADGAHVEAHRPADAQDAAPTRAHVGAIPRRSTQTIPPKVRRAVFCRDGGRCRVPGCRHAVYTDVHHLVLRSEDGKHDLDNLVTLCGAHHHAIHSGKLIVTGSASSRLDFSHADGTPYGGAVAPAVADARAQAFRALTGMGFGEGEAKRTLARIPPSVSSLEHLIRQALHELASQ